MQTKARWGACLACGAVNGEPFVGCEARQAFWNVFDDLYALQTQSSHLQENLHRFAAVGMCRL
jgi:hypothetical protein